MHPISGRQLRGKQASIVRQPTRPTRPREQGGATMHPLVRTMLAACVALLCADSQRSMAQRSFDVEDAISSRPRLAANRPFNSEEVIAAGLAGYRQWNLLCKWERREIRLLIVVPDDQIIATRQRFEARGADRASLESATGRILSVDVVGAAAAAGASYDALYDGRFMETDFFLGQRTRALEERLIERDRDRSDPPTQYIVFASRSGALERIILHGNVGLEYDSGLTHLLAEAFGIPRFPNKALSDYSGYDHALEFLILRSILKRLYDRPETCARVSDLYRLKGPRNP